MGKSILVMDTPECCDYCPAGRIFGMAGQVECRAREALHVNSNGRTVPSWCHLETCRKEQTIPIIAITEDMTKGGMTA